MSNVCMGCAFYEAMGCDTSDCLSCGGVGVEESEREYEDCGDADSQALSWTGD